MAGRKKQSLLDGALILSAAIIAVKLIGVFFKLYVTLKIGYDGRGYYATAYNIYTPIYSIALAGFPTAVSKMVASKAAAGKYRDVKALFSISMRIFTIAGAAGTVLILLLAFPYAKSISPKIGGTIVTDYNPIPSILAIAPSMFFCCVMSGYRGYYQGLRDMTPSAISQVLEAGGKLLFGWLLINSVMASGAAFADKIPILRDLVTDASQSYAAAAAIMGVTIGSLMGLLYLMFRHMLIGTGIPSAAIRRAPHAADKSVLTREFIAIAIPIAISALVSNITLLIDNWTIQNRLQYVLDANYPAVAAMYPGIVSARGFTEEMTTTFKVYLFGAYDTVLEIKNIVPTFTITLGLSAIPVLSEAWVNRDKKTIRRSVNSVIRMTMLLAMPAGIGMVALAEDILFLLYGTSEVNAPAIPYIAPILMMYGVSVIFLALNQPITNMLQAIDRMDVPIKAMAIGATLKIVANYLLVSIPSINIRGAVIGSLLCNIVIDAYGMIVLRRDARVKFNYRVLFLNPLLCSLASGLAAFIISRVAGLFIKDSVMAPSFFCARNVVTVIAVLAAVAVYLFALFFTHSIRKQDILSLPMGEKIAKVLEKRGIIG